MVFVSKDFLQRFGGALIAGLTDAVIEAFVAPGQSWAAKPLFGVEPLPPVDDWAILGASLAPWLYGKYAHNSTIENIGEGMLSYSAAMILHHMVIRAQMAATTPAWVPARTPATGTPRATVAPAPRVKVY